jgi:DNA-binding MarR family transcriptional regulator
MPRTPSASQAVVDEVTDAVLVASRALVSVAAKSLAGVEHDVTLPQYRAVVVLASRGPLNAGELAEALGVHPSTVTRLCDRLVAKSLVERRPHPDNRREVVLAPTAEGRRLVDQVGGSAQRSADRLARHASCVGDGAAGVRRCRQGCRQAGQR